MINPVNFNSSSHFSSSSSQKTNKNTPATDPEKTAEEVVKVMLGQQNTKKAAENLGVSLGTTLRTYIAYAKKVCVEGNTDISNFNYSLPLLQKIVDKYNEITKKPPIKLQFSRTISSKKTYKNKPTTNPEKTVEEVVKVMLGQQNIEKAAENLGVSAGFTLKNYIKYAKKVCVKGDTDISKFDRSVPLLQKIVDKYNEITQKPAVKLSYSIQQQSSSPNSNFSSSSQTSTSSSKKVRTYKEPLFTNPDSKGKRKLNDRSEEERNPSDSDSLDKDNYFSLISQELAPSAGPLIPSKDMSDNDSFHLLANDFIDPSQVPIPETDELGFYESYMSEEQPDKNALSDALMDLTPESLTNSISPSSISESDASENLSPEPIDPLDLSHLSNTGDDFLLTNQEQIASQSAGIYSQDLQDKESPDDWLRFLGADAIDLPKPIETKPMSSLPQSSSSSSSLSSRKTTFDDNLLSLSNTSSNSSSLSAIVISSSSTPSGRPPIPSALKLNLSRQAKQKLIDNPSKPTTYFDFTVSDFMDIYRQCKAKIKEIPNSRLSAGDTLEPKLYPLHVIDALVQPTIKDQKFFASNYGIDGKTFTLYINALKDSTEDKYHPRINKNIVKAARLIKEGLDHQPKKIPPIK